MPFHIAPLTKSDIPAFAEADDLAMADWPVAQAMDLAARKGPYGSRKAMIEVWMSKAFESPEPNSEAPKPNGEWIKVVDSESGKLVAAASWTWHLSGDFVDRPPRERKEGEGEGVMDAMGRQWREFREGWFKDCHWYHLQTLITHPDYQRRGAGSMLVKYGCDKADEAGVMCTLQATASGLNVYLKNGFQIVNEVEWDLGPFGIDATELRRWMIRQPQTKKSEGS